MNYSTIPTVVGAAKLRNASLLGQKVDITRVAFGDGDGAEYEPTGQEPALKKQVYECPPNRIEEEAGAPTWIELEAVIPHNVGGWYLREVGCFDDEGDLIFIGNLPSSFKPSGEAGVIKDLVFEMVYDAVAADVVQIKIDPNVVIATRKYVDDQDNAHTDAPDPHPQYATDDDLSQAMQQAGNDLSNLISISQFLPYDKTRKYKTGEICYTKDQETNELSYWQWYSNVESLAGKSPLLEANRHVGWSDNTKPFYWVPYTGDQVGMPFYWLDTVAPEWAVMEINVDLPIAVYWRLARRYPHLVTDDTINTGEIRAEFLRVLDQGRGVDTGRVIGSYQAWAIENITGSFESSWQGDHAVLDGLTGAFEVGRFGSRGDVPQYASGGTTAQKAIFDASNVVNTASETRSRNVARPMAIVI